MFDYRRVGFARFHGDLHHQPHLYDNTDVTRKRNGGFQSSSTKTFTYDSANYMWDIPKQIYRWIQASGLSHGFASNKNWELDIWFSKKIGHWWFQYVDSWISFKDNNTSSFNRTWDFHNKSSGFPGGFSIFFCPARIPTPLSQDFGKVYLVLRRLAEGHQLATGDQEARHNDQHATWCERRMRIKGGTCGWILLACLCFIDHGLTMVVA